MALPVQPVAVKLYQIERQLFNAFPRFVYRALPFPRAKVGKMGGGLVPANVFLHAVELIRRHVKLIPARVNKVQIVPRYSRHLKRYNAHEAAYAVQLMHHQIAHAKLAEGQFGLLFGG